MLIHLLTLIVALINNKKHNHNMGDKTGVWLGWFTPYISVIIVIILLVVLCVPIMVACLRLLIIKTKNFIINSSF